MLQVSIKVKDGTSLETGIRQTLKAQLPKNHEFLRCSDNVSLTQLYKATRVVQEEDELTDILDGIDIPPIGSRKFETLDKRSASGDVEEDVEETKLKHELVKIIRSGQTKTLRPNSGKCTKIGNQLVYVTNYMEPESDYRIWEWYGNIKLAFDDNSEFKTEFVHGTYKENVKAGLDNGSSGDDSEDVQEDGVSGSERKSHKAVLKIGMKPELGLSFTTIKNPNNVKDGTSLETGIRQTLKAQLPKNHEFLRLTDIEDGIDIPPIESQKFETLDMGSASGDVEEDVDESGVEVRDVELAMKLARVSRPIAVKALKTHKKEPIGPIFDLTELEKVISERLITLRRSLKPSSEVIQQDVVLDEETKKHPLVQEETKLKHELVKIIRSGQTKTLRPNSDKCTKIRNQHIYVTNYMEPESDYRIWEWYGNIKLAFDDNSEFKTEFVHGTYKENVKAGLDNRSSGDDSEDAQEDGVSGSERKSHKAVLKIGMKPELGLSFTTIKNPNNVKDGTSLETGIRQTLKAQLPKNHEFLRLTDIEDGIDIPPIESQKFETLDMGSASGDVEEDVDESGVEVRDVELAMKLARVSRPIAVKALKTHKKEPIGPIFDLTELEKVISERLITLRRSLKPSSEVIQQDVVLDEETKKHPLVQEETKLKHELVKIIRSGQTKTLRPNSDKCTKIRNQHIYVTNYMEPESDYRIWEWYGNIKLAFDDNSEFKTEFVHGTYKENVKAGLDNRSSGDDSEDAQEDGVSRSERKSRQALLKIGMKPELGVSLATLKTPNNGMSYILKPDVFKSSNSDTYVIFGEEKIGDLKRGDTGSTSAIVDDAEEEDERGIRDCDIELVMTKTGMSRPEAVKAIKTHSGDVVGAILEFDMEL